MMYQQRKMSKIFDKFEDQFFQIRRVVNPNSTVYVQVGQVNEKTKKKY